MTLISRKKFTARRYFVYGLFWLTCLSLILVGCSNLSGEPEIVATIAPTITPPPAQPHAIDSAVIETGALIFSQRCTSCHGVDADGNGDLVRSSQIPAPPSFREHSTVADISPQEWFTIITLGRIDNMMPPWADALTLEERWAVAMYTYTLSYTSDQISAGEELLTANPELATALTPLIADQETLTSTSDSDLAQLVTDLPASDQQAVVAYLRAQSLVELNVLDVPVDTTVAQVQETPVSPSATEEVTNAETTAQAQPTISADLPTLTLTGSITNGTPDSAVPVDLEVTLRIFDEEFNERNFTTTITADNTFTFDDIPVNENWIYFATTEFDGSRFGINTEPNIEGMDFPIVIYEVTNDPSVINITGEVLQIGNANNSGALEVLHVIRYRNSSDQMYISGEGEDGLQTSILMTLPVGAIIVRTDNQNRYIIPDDNSGLVDTFGVFPGDSHIITVNYLVPYIGVAIIEYPTTYDYNGTLRILINDPELTITGELASYTGEEILGENIYQSYGSDLTLTAGESIAFSIEGGGVPTSTDDNNVVTSNNLIPVIGAFLVILGIFGAMLIYLNRNNTNSTPTDSKKDRLIDGLVHQISELDAEHDAGDINHDVYHARRKELKNRLSKLIDGDSDIEEDTP